MTVSGCPNQGMHVLCLSGDAVHFPEDSREEGALSTTNGSDDGGQATLLDGHVDIVDESLGLLSVLVGSRSRSRSIVLLSPLERSVGDTDGIGVDWVGIRGNWDSLRSHQEGVYTAPGSSGDGTCTKWQAENVAFRKTVRDIPEELGKCDQRLNQHGEEGDGGEDTSSGDFTLVLAEQGQGGDGNQSVGQLTDDDEDGDADIESPQVLELGLTDDLEALEEDALPAANLDQRHTLHDLLNHLHALVAETSEHGSRGAEEERNYEDEEKESAEQNSNTGPDGDTEDTVEEVDGDTELNGDGPGEVTELDCLRNSLGVDVNEVQDVALLEPSDTLGTKTQGLLVDSANEGGLDTQGSALDHVLGGTTEDGLENLGTEQREGENPEGGSEQGDTTSDFLNGVVERLRALGGLGTFRSTGGDDQLLDEDWTEQTHEDGKEPKKSRSPAKEE